MRHIPLTLCATLAVAASTAAFAQDGSFSDGVIRIGVMNDRSGIYADMSGEGSAIAARMAAESFGNAIGDVPVEIVVADHQNKPDIGASIAAKWFDVDGVDVIVDVNNSAVSLAINALMPERKKLVLQGSASSEISGKGCAPRSIQWQWSTYAPSSKVVTQEMIDGGLDTFFVIAVDYAMGDAITAAFTASVEKMGGKVIDTVRHPLNSPDLSSFVLQAQASGAKAIMLANAGNDLGNTMRQLREYGVTPEIPVFAAMLGTDIVDTFGYEVMQGLRGMSQANLDRSDESRAWAAEFEKRKGAPPSQVQASVYSSVLNYLAAVQAAGTDDADTVDGQLRTMTINDATFDNGRVRADGLHVHDMYLVKVKAPDQVSGPGDYYEVETVLSGDEANIPLEESECPLVQ